jgi:hypothetical protein
MKWFLISLILLPLYVFNQEIISNYKTWDEGQLTWDDFQAKPFSTLDMPSDFSFILGFETEKLKIKDTTLIHLKATAYFIKDASWINPSAKSEINLLFNQVIFDNVELNRRRMQKEMNALKFSFQANGYLDIYYKRINQEIHELQNLIQQGNFTYAIQKKSSEVRNELSSEKLAIFPPFHRSAFGFGMHAGFGVGFLTGSLGRHFQTTRNLLLGFDMGYKNLVLYLNGSLNYGSVVKNYMENYFWQRGMRTGIAIMEASMGYNVLDGSKFKIAPFAGISLIEISKRENKDETTNDFRMVDYNRLIGGINLDYKWRKRFNFSPSASSFKEYVETDVRLRLYFLMANYYLNLNGYSINLTLGVNGFANFLRLNKR